MATVSGTKSDPSDPLIAGLVYGTYWTVTEITYYYPQTADQYADPNAAGFNGGKIYNGGNILPVAATFKPFTSDMQKGVDLVLGYFSAVANLNFVKKTDDSLSDQALIRYGFTSIDDPQWGGDTSLVGCAAYPGDGLSAGDVWFPTTIYNYGNWATPGSFTFEDVLHETGHALGLSHPPDVNNNLPSLSSHNSNEYTVMAYNKFLRGGTLNSDTYLQSLMMDDIAALQYIYGANFNHNAGNTTYQWSAVTGQMTAAENGISTTSEKPVANEILMTVWDGGGVDTYDFSNYAANLKVNLQPGGWTTVDPAQLAKSTDQTYVPPGSIANALLYQNNVASLIENAIGGPGNDLILGNQANNSLEGGAGADSLQGLYGDDTLLGGAGDDSLYGGVGNDSLEGGANNDQLYGGVGNDTLDGGAGNDALRGGLGDDVYKFGLGSGKDTITQGDGGADRLEFEAGVAWASISWSQSGNDLIAKLNASDRHGSL